VQQASTDHSNRYIANFLYLLRQSLTHPAPWVSTY